MQANKPKKLILASLLAANAAKALHLGGEQTSTAPAALAQVQSESAVQAQLNVAAVSQIETQTAIKRFGETDFERNTKAASEKVKVIFKKILDGIEEKREEALAWLCDFGDDAIGQVLDKADALNQALQTLADSRVSDMEDRQVAVNQIVEQTLNEAKQEMYRLKAEAADAVTEKRKEVMYAIKDLKIEIGTTFKKDVKAEKKAQIEWLVSELESFINKTIRTYDENVEDQLRKVNSATSAAAAALWDEKEEAEGAFNDAKEAAEGALCTFIDESLDGLQDAVDEKNASATEVFNYLAGNFYRYLTELLTVALEDASESEVMELVAVALRDREEFLAEVASLNQELTEAMAHKQSWVVRNINAVKGGKTDIHVHDDFGRIVRDENGNAVKSQNATEGWVSQAMDIGDGMINDMNDIEDDQKGNNSAANGAAGEANDVASDWLDTACMNELEILAEFLEKGFAYAVDTTDFVTHTTHPYAPFSTGDYNELVDQINGFEQFFHYWKRTRERAIDTLATCKTTAKLNVSTDVFDVDIPELEAVADGLLVVSNGAAEGKKNEGDQDLEDSQKRDTQTREHIEMKVNKGKAKIFREIGFMVKKLYRATREEYKDSIKEDLEATIDQFNKKLADAKKELDNALKNSENDEKKKDEQKVNDFKTDFIDQMLKKFDEYDEEHSPQTIGKLIEFRDDIMEPKIAQARAEIEAGLLKKERGIAAAYEAVKLKISKIEDHHFQYNVRTLLEDAKAEADRRCAHEEDGAGDAIDGIEEWVWDFVEESTIRYNEKVKAEREALAAGLNAAGDRLWEALNEDQEVNAEHQEHERHALDYFLKDCIKGLKHLFNRYGYVSPQFQEDENKQVKKINAKKIVNTLGPDPDDEHKVKDDDDSLKSWEDQATKNLPRIGCVRGEDGMCECQKYHTITADKSGEQERVCECYVKLTNDGECPAIDYNCFDCPSLQQSYEKGDSNPDGESRSSCTGSSCDVSVDGKMKDHEIQLDSLEDLAHVIEEEVVNNKPKGRTLTPKDREYDRFIDENGMVITDDAEVVVDLDPVKVPAPVAPTKDDIIPDAEPEVKPWENRETTTYTVDEMPDFGEIKLSKPVVVEPEPVKVPDVAPASETLNDGDDIWGAYLAKWKKPEVTVVKPVVPVHVHGVVHAHHTTPTFDVGNYLAKSRELAPAVGVSTAGAGQYWWDAEEQDDEWAAEDPWWEQLAVGYENDVSYKPTKQNFVPNSTYLSKSSQDRFVPNYKKPALKKYWWQ